MIRQHQQRFDERNQEHRDHHHRNGARELPLRAGRGQQCGKRRRRGEHREEHRRADPPGPVNGRSGPLAPALPFGKDAFAHDDRVIHDDSQRQHQRHQREHVHRDAQQLHEQEGPDERHGEPHRHPQSQPQLQEQRQRDQHERQPQQRVLDHQAKASRDLDRVVLPDVDIDPRRQRRLDFGRQIVAHGRRDLEHLLVGTAVDVDADRRLPVVAHAQIGVGEPVPHGRDVAQPQRRAVRARQEDDVLEVRLVVVPPERAHEDFFGVGGHRARGQFHRALPHRRGDIVQREPQRPQPPQRHLDRYLVGAGAADFGQRHCGQRRDPLFDVVGQLLEGTLRDIAMDQQADHVLAAGDLAHLRPLRFRGERDDPIDLGLDLVQRPADVGARLEPRDDRSEALGRRRFRPVQPLDPPDLLLDAPHDRLLDLRGRRAGVQDKHLHLVQRKLRKHLLHQVPGREQTREDQKEHEHVGGDTVSHHERDWSALAPGSGRRSGCGRRWSTHLTRS